MECLAGALTEMGTKHVIWRMNPKAITAPQARGLTLGTKGLRCLRNGGVFDSCGTREVPPAITFRGGV